MIVQTHFDQFQGVTASRLSYALELLDAGQIDSARSLIAEVQLVNEQQARVTDPRIYSAIRHLCESRQIDSRRLLPMLQTLGFREIARTLMISKAADVINLHLPIENDFFVSMLGQIPKCSALEPINADNFRDNRGEYKSGNQRLWEVFCQQEAESTDGSGS